MELDEQLGVHNPPPSWDNKDQDDYLEVGDEDDMEDKVAKSERATSETITYGMELKSEFANDPRREVKRALEDTFALIAYADARESSLAPLLEISGRAPVAEELNSAILGTYKIEDAEEELRLTTTPTQSPSANPPPQPSNA